MAVATSTSRAEPWPIIALRRDAPLGMLSGDPVLQSRDACGQVDAWLPAELVLRGGDVALCVTDVAIAVLAVDVRCGIVIVGGDGLGEFEDLSLIHISEPTRRTPI